MPAERRFSVGIVVVAERPATPQPAPQTPPPASPVQNVAAPTPVSAHAPASDPPGDAPSAAAVAATALPPLTDARPDVELPPEPPPDPSPAESASASPLATSVDLILDDTETRVAVRDDPIGHWMVSVDDQVRAAWVYPVAQRLGGVTGTVTVAFTVRRNGRIVDARIVSGSGNPYLDVAAMAAVPASVSPLPRGAPRKIEVRYTFRYR